jgi:hypothetical protein
MHELDEIDSVFKQSKSVVSTEQGEEDSCSETSDSETLDTKDTSTVALKLIEEFQIARCLTRPVPDVPSSPARRNRDGKKSRRQRGESLEREISKAILETAFAGANEAHFVVENTETMDPEGRTAQYILSDLIEGSQVESQSSCSTSTYSTEDQNSQVDSSKSSRATETMQESQINNQEDSSLLGPRKSNEDASVKPDPNVVGDNDTDNSVSDAQSAHRCNDTDGQTEVPRKGIVKIPLGPRDRHTKPRTPTKVDPPCGPQAEKEASENTEHQKQEVIFNVNYDEWSAFDPPPFDDSPFKGFENELDSNGFPTAPPSKVSRVPRLKSRSPPPPPPPRKRLLDPPQRPSPPRGWGRTGEVSPSIGRQPKSPASVLDFRNNGQGHEMARHSNPQFPRHRTTGLVTL